MAIREEGYEGDLKVYMKFKKDYNDLTIPLKDLKDLYGGKPYYRYRRMLLEENGGVDCRSGGKYYGKFRNSYRVCKRIDGEIVYFGCYKLEETAIRVVEYLKSINWDIHQFELFKKFII